MDVIKNQTTDIERAFYHLTDTRVENCKFQGPADGESAFKEARNIEVIGCEFLLRYPMWHVEKFLLDNSKMAETARAAIWYAKCGEIKNCILNGVKLLRESSDIKIFNTSIKTSEFGWRCRDIEIADSEISSDYLLFESKNIKTQNFKMSGKYSFQYVENMTIEDSVLDTKDAFWHSKDVVVKNSLVKGEYLGWYSENLTFENCKIIGTQPLCYCKNLKLVNCTMEEADLAFEYSDVNADINGTVLSVKNPLSGIISADKIEEIILSDSVYPCNCEIREK